MHPILFRYHGCTIYTYGFFAAVAFLTAYFVSWYRAKKLGWPEFLVTDILCIILLAGFFGARLFYVFQNWPVYKDDPVRIFWIQEGGLVWYGGFIVATTAALSYTRRKRLSALLMADFFAPTVALAHAIGRLGCFFNGCCFGKATASFRHPTQIYEALILFFLSIFLFYLSKRKKWQGEVFICYLILYSLARFLLEFLRDGQPSFLFLTIPQWTSLFLMAGSFFMRSRLSGEVLKK